MVCDKGKSKTEAINGIMGIPQKLRNNYDKLEKKIQCTNCNENHLLTQNGQQFLIEHFFFFDKPDNSNFKLKNIFNHWIAATIIGSITTMIRHSIR